MPRPALTFVALSTTGPRPPDDALLEAATVRVEPDGSTSRYCGITPAAAKLEAASGTQALTCDESAGAVSPRAVMKDLLEAAGGSQIVSAAPETLEAFIAASRLRAPQILDLRELAAIACPTASDFTAEALAPLLDIDLPDPTGAQARAELLLRVWQAMQSRLASMPEPVLRMMRSVVRAAGHVLAPFVSDIAGADTGFELKAPQAQEYHALIRDERDLIREAQKADQVEPTDEQLRVDDIARLFEPEGLVGRNLRRYERRSEQVEMLEAVCDAFNSARHLLIEAGTGTGKSLAYLIPAIAWACTNNDKVLVSTNTKNLQEQLYRKDLPFLSSIFPDRFKAALLKGRRNYLCVRRFLHVLTHFERELSGPDEFMALAPLAAWAWESESGDLAECNGFQSCEAASAVARWIITGPDECLGGMCRFRGKCFVAKARARARTSDLVVVNHAVLFSELGLDTPVLPPYRCIVFDEAHNLEDAATDTLGITLDAPTLYRSANLLFRPRRDGGGSGLLATVMHEIDRAAAKAPSPRFDSARESTGKAMETVQEACDAIRQFFEVLRAPFESLPPSVERILLAECTPPIGEGSLTWESAEAVCTVTRRLRTLCMELADFLEETSKLRSSASELASDLTTGAARLCELASRLLLVLGEQEDSHVFWVQRTSRDTRSFYSLHAAPLQLGPYMREHLFDQKRCVVLTSATMQVDGSFDYMLERLGVEGMPASRSQCLALGSPFDYTRQSLVGVTSFLPDPGGQRSAAFDRQLCRFLVDLLRCTEGRALVLFTSYALLQAVHDAVKEPLERAGVMVLAQGISGSREAITDRFRGVTSSVLLGTRSFWEGVDVSGEALSCLVLTKLPFHVFTDPLIRARSEYLRNLGRNPFMHYTLPEAVISFRQGFGRLIRSGTDRGVVVCTDNRLLTKQYGRSFLRSLPTRHRVFERPQDALDAVASFFARDRSTNGQN